LLPRIPYTGPGKGADDCRHALGGDFNNWWRARITDAMHVGPQSDAPVLAVRLFEREEAGLAELDGDALAKAQERLVKLAAALHRSVLLQERVVSFVEKKLKIRRSVFNRAVEAAVKAGALPAEPDELEVYYDPGRKCYWLPNNRGEMIEINETSLLKHLRKAGFGGDKEDGLSPLDQRIIQIQRERDVAYAGPLGGHRTGLHEMCGCRVLVTRSPKIIEPREGDCPNINALIRGLLADETRDQVTYVLGWLKIAYEALVEGSLRPGQALAIAGPRNSGKSLLQNLITEILGGRAAKPYRYMCGNTDFNGDLFGAEHLMIEDEVSFTDIRARRHFGARIKDFTVNLVQSCHAKNRQALSLKPFWRVTITLNDEPENLLILPPIDESLEDKIILLKATKAVLPVDTSTSAGRQKFMSMLLDELPAFLWHLTQFQIPTELKSERFGITHLHHPDLLAALDDMSPELRLLTLIDGMIAENEDAGEWHGTAADLERLLFESKYAHEARRLLDWNNATGTYLGRLAKKCPQRVKAVRNAQRREWIITPAHWVQESDTVEMTPNPF
jgi:hypothetical protein